MAAEFTMVWTGSMLSPINASEHEALDQRLGQGEVVTIRIGKLRSKPQLDYYWAKLSALIESGATPKMMDAETLHELLKLEMGFVKPVITLRGKLEFHPKSIAMDKLKQDEMNEFMTKAWALIAEFYHVNMDDIGGDDITPP